MERIKGFDSDLSFFYSTHPDISFFRAIWDLDEERLGRYYGEYKARHDARAVSSEGLYLYTWKFFPAKYFYNFIKPQPDGSFINQDSLYYYIPMPKEMLPLSTMLSGKYLGKTYIHITHNSTETFVDPGDNPTGGGDWFNLRLGKNRFSIQESSITMDGVSNWGLWFGDYIKDENAIEDHFGEILDIKINRKLYERDPSWTPNDEHYYPSKRIAIVHKKYGMFMKDIVIALINKHPSLANIKQMLTSAVVNYALKNADSLSVRDRVTDAWESLKVHSLFTVSADIYDNVGKIDAELFDTMSKLMEYYKPIFSRAIIGGTREKSLNEGIIISDITSYNKAEMSVSEYRTKTLMRPLFKKGIKITDKKSMTAIRDDTDYNYVKNYIPGEYNE
jgi:hypothetical protein